MPLWLGTSVGIGASAGETSHDREAGSAKPDGESTIIRLFTSVLEMSAFHDEAQAAVGYITGRGSISTKK